jgi:ferredoxin
MKLKVNKDACIGCGACAATAEDLLEMNDEGYSQPKVEVVPEDKKAAAEEVVGVCPTGAISIEE